MGGDTISAANNPAQRPMDGQLELVGLTGFGLTQDSRRGCDARPAGAVRGEQLCCCGGCRTVQAMDADCVSGRGRRRVCVRKSRWAASLPWSPIWWSDGYRADAYLTRDSFSSSNSRTASASDGPLGKVVEMPRLRTRVDLATGGRRCRQAEFRAAYYGAFRVFCSVGGRKWPPLVSIR